MPDLCLGPHSVWCKLSLSELFPLPSDVAVLQQD